MVDGRYCFVCHEFTEGDAPCKCPDGTSRRLDVADPVEEFTDQVVLTRNADGVVATWGAHSGFGTDEAEALVVLANKLRAGKLYPCDCGQLVFTFYVARRLLAQPDVEEGGYLRCHYCFADDDKGDDLKLNGSQDHLQVEGGATSDAPKS